VWSVLKVWPRRTDRDVKVPRPAGGRGRGQYSDAFKVVTATGATILPGLLFTFFYAGSHWAVGGLWAMACLAGGALVGFVFSVPKVVQDEPRGPVRTAVLGAAQEGLALLPARQLTRRPAPRPTRTDPPPYRQRRRRANPLVSSTRQHQPHRDFRFAHQDYRRHRPRGVA
jgi:hypothetical protein